VRLELKIKVYRLILLLLVVTLTSCTSPEESNEIDNKNLDYETSHVDVSYYSSNKEAFGYDSILIDGQHYLKIKDFVELANEVNKEISRIEPLDLDFYQNEQLQITYRTDDVRNAIKRDLVYLTDFKYESSDIEVINPVLNYKLEDFDFQAHTVEDMDYLPLDAIRYVIFNMEMSMIRKSLNEYLILGKAQYGLVNKELLPDDIKSANDYGELMTLEHDLKLINYHLNSSKIIDPIIDYNDYFRRLVMILDNQRDYHANYIPIGHNFNKEALINDEMEAFVETSFGKELYEMQKSTFLNDEIEFECLDDLAYLRIGSFESEENYFRTMINRFVSELSQSKQNKIMIDLRDNTGGRVNNMMYLLGYLLDSELTIRQNLYAGHQHIAKQTLTLTRNKRNINNYDITVIVNENSMSASVVISHILKENLNAKVIGLEPFEKQTGSVSPYQSIAGTIIMNSNNMNLLVNSQGQIVDQTPLVDEEMNNDQIESLLEINNIVNRQTIKEGLYELTTSTDPLAPRISIDGMEFTFSYDPLSSYLPIGKYSMSNGLVRMVTYDNKYHYVFILENNKLIFQKDKSSPLHITDKKLTSDIEDQAEFMWIE